MHCCNWTLLRCIGSIEAADKRKNWRGVVIAVQDMKEFGHPAGIGEATARALSQAACLRAIKSLHGHGRWWEVFDAADTLAEVRFIFIMHKLCILLLSFKAQGFVTIGKHCRCSKPS
jgi:hypothetical protein